MSAGDTFALQIDAFVKKAKGDADKIVRKVLLDVGRRVVELSPVGNPELWAENQVALMNRDMYKLWIKKSHKATVSESSIARKFPLRSVKGYVGGRFRANWQYGVGTPPQGTLYSPGDKRYPSGSQVLASLTSAIPTTGLAKMHYIVNNLPYAQRLEDGWSSQAPGGMVAITVIEYQMFINDAIKNL